MRKKEYKVREGDRERKVAKADLSGCSSSSYGSGSNISSGSGNGSNRNKYHNNTIQAKRNKFIIRGFAAINHIVIG